jgi:hypothetical protein
MNHPVVRGDAVQQSRSAVEIAKRQPKFGAGKFRIDRLVRIEARFSRSKLSWASHAISFETFLIRRSHLLPDRRRIQQVNCAKVALTKAIEPFCKMDRLPFRVIDCAVGHIDYVSPVRK